MEEKNGRICGVLEENIRENGVALETVIAMEECAELIQAISKVKRYGFIGEYKDNLIEEIADVNIVVHELMMIFDISNDDIAEFIDSKIQRIKKRLGERR